MLFGFDVKRIDNICRLKVNKLFQLIFVVQSSDKHVKQ